MAEERPVVAIVGASSGIGRATAQRFLQDGWRVAALARRGHLLEELFAASGAGPDRALPWAGDATRLPDLQGFVAAVDARWGRLDVLVLNQGLNIRRRALAELTPEDWERVRAVNLDAAFYGTHAALPILRRQGGGLIIYISSVSGLWPDASGAAYQAAKHGLRGLAHAVRVEEQVHGVRASVVYPGIVNTPLVLNRPRVPSPEELERALQPEDVAACCAFLASLPPRVVVTDLVLRPRDVS